MNIETLQSIFDVIQILLSGINSFYNAYLIGKDIYNNYGSGN